MAHSHRQYSVATLHRARPANMARTPLTVLVVLLAFSAATLAGCDNGTPKPTNSPEPGGGGHAEITLGRLSQTTLHAHRHTLRLRVDELAPPAAH